MTPVHLCIFLFAIGIVLIAGEMVLPTHGLLGIIGGGAILGAIGIGFYMNQWLGAGMLVLTLIMMPVAGTLWPKMAGRRLILPTTETLVRPPRVGLGQTGIAVSDLRPMGWCEFDDQRHEVRAETNVIHAGSQVRVVSVEAGRLIVREV
jgi:membrane-bound serine protease (ClpP class)